MYRCDLCSTVVPPNTTARRVVLATRPTEYASRPKSIPKREGRKTRYADDPGGAGHEIAREALTCRSCAGSPGVTAEAAE